MFGYDSKLKLKELLLFIAEQELTIEKMRQILSAIRDFEPYAAFKRLDRNSTGFISTKELCQFERENGFREVTPEDFIFMVSYFDLDNDGMLNYHDFLQILLPCDNPFLRSAATQRPN
jgi:Ca2+-binding EF-hand superfamily protein